MGAVALNITTIVGIKSGHITQQLPGQRFHLHILVILCSWRTRSNTIMIIVSTDNNECLEV